MLLTTKIHSTYVSKKSIQHKYLVASTLYFHGNFNFTQSIWETFFRNVILNHDFKYKYFFF